MSERRFFDTNVLLYALASKEVRKRKTAQSLVRQHAEDATLVVSTQVLQEFFVTQLERACRRTSRASVLPNWRTQTSCR